MRIHKVELTGFGAFKGAETVDFDAFAADGKFVIVGKTGAGKSTILDAISYALFGSVPRYDGTRGTPDEQVRSRYLADAPEPTEVSVEFSVGARRYRVRRRPAYLIPGHKRLTQPWAEIAELRDGEWAVLASRQLRSVGAAVGAIVRLSAEQFGQVILLAQGQFQEFLVADSTSRRDLLRKLFGTRRFDDYSKDLDVRAAELRRAVETAAASIAATVAAIAAQAEREPPAAPDPDAAAVLGWAEALVAEQHELLSAAGAAATTAKADYDAALTARTQARWIDHQQRQRASAQARRAVLDASHDEIAAARARIEQASRAELAWAAVRGEREAQSALRAATAAQAAARAAHRTLFPDAEQSAASLTARVTELTGALATATEAVARERALHALRANAEAAAQAAERAAAAVSELRAQRVALIEAAPRLDADALAAGQQAAGLAAADALVAELTRQLASARAAEQTRAKLSAADAARHAASRAVDAASATRTELLERQLASYAGVLADELADGAECPVCGSTEHPNPARLTAGRVTDAELADAERTVTQAQRGYESASNTVTALGERLASERELSDDLPAAEINARLVPARGTRDAAAAAQRALAELNQRRADLRADIDALTARLDAAKDAHATQDGEAKRASALRDAERDAVVKARGAYRTVADRVAATAERLAASRSLLTATAERDSAQQAAVAAAARLTETLRQHRFADAGAAAAARLPEPERDELAERIRRFDAEQAAVSELLGQDDLRGLPDDPVDVAAAERSHDLAEASNRAATQALGQARMRASAIDKLATPLTRQLRDTDDARRRFAVVDRLAATIRGQGPNTKKMTLEAFALAADLEEIVTAANVLLGAMTAHRFELQYSDELAKGGGQSGLAIDVIDAYNQETRPPQSLSGGEKFQASLALALGLAEVVTNRNGGVRLDTLFIDEGFGALDPETLDVTLDTLDALREGGRIVGLISHVDQVKERIPNHIEVTVTDQGWSTLTG